MIEQLERALAGDITIAQVEAFRAWTGCSVVAFWSRWDVHPSTWRRWRDAGEMPLFARIAVGTWWALERARADAQLAKARAGEPNSYAGHPPAFE